MRIKHILTILIAVSTISCSKSFLEVDPIGKITTDKMFKDIEGMRAALNGAYTLMSGFYSNQFTLYGDAAGDHVIISDGKSAIWQQYNYQSNPFVDTTAVLYIWETAFAAMDNANRILNSVPTLRSNFPALKNEIDSIEGQALIFRALTHFDLSRVYSQTYTYTEQANHLGVPLLSKSPGPGQPVSRGDMKSTYEFIIRDLKQAEQLLRKFSRPDNYTASYSVVWALLSRIYLYKHDWDNSIAYADSVIQKSGLSLTSASDYAKMFRTFQSGGNEVIWQLYRKGMKQGKVSEEYLTNIAANAKLSNLFSADDIRKTELFLGTATLKYRPEILTTPVADWAVNPKVARLSEIYLNRAEAHWNKGNYAQAGADVKIIAQRAHPASTVVVPADPAQLMNFIEDERSRELCFEGHRLYDITRRHQSLARGSDCNAATCSLTYPNNKFVLPIPGAELDANKAMQPNPGVN